jgi:selenocysteine-specific elongation factor
VALSGGAMKRGARVVVHVGTASPAAKVTRVDGLAEGRQLLRLVLDAPLPLAPGERLLVRGGALAGGRVLDARPLARMPARARLTLARALDAGDARAALDHLVEAVAPRPLDVGALAMAAPLAAEAESAIAERRLLACGTAVVHRRTIKELALRARERVTKHLAESPLDRGIPLASLRSELARISSEPAADLALRAARAQKGADDGGMIAIDGGVVVPATARRELPPEVARVAEVLAKAGPHGITSGYLCEELGFAPARARAVLAALERSAVAVRAGELWFSRPLLDDVRARIVAHLGSARALTVADTKALCGLPRRQAISILEHLDATGVTRRQGDARILAPETPS